MGIFVVIETGGDIQSRSRKKYYRPKKYVFGLYTRKMLFFVSIFGMAIIAYQAYLGLKISADITGYGTSSSDNGSSRIINMEIKQNGTVLVDGKDNGTKLNTLSDSDELPRVPIIDSPDKYINRLTVNLKLPQPVASKVTHDILAIHGVESAYSEVVDDSNIRYIANGVAQTATVTVIAKLPKGIIDRSVWSQLFSLSSQVKFSFWIYLALALPVFTFIFMLAFIRYTTRMAKVDMPDRAISSPPMSIPPALVGALYHQKVTPREIAATLIDLALRKDIFILDRERGFAFGKGRFDQRLLGYEKLLLAKIFRNNLSSDQEMIEQKVQSQIYSKKVSMVSAGIYAIATRLGYFRENPRRIHAKYWLFGIVAIVIGLAGFAASFILKTMPTFTAFFWVGMMISAIIIIVMAGNIPMRTEIGKDALSNWLAFRKYLIDPNPIEYSPTVYQLFEAYLPYAVVLDCEAAWSRRFAQHTFIVPDWFLTERNGLGMEDFCLALFPIVSYVGRSLAAMREPGFE